MSFSENSTDTKGEGPKVAAIGGRVGKPADTVLGDHHLERLATSFEVSARRWELVVYPALFAFIVLACYGFYLIYNLTHDVGQLAQNVSSLTASVDSMARNLNDITGDMTQVSGAMGEVSTKMDALEPMRQSMASMENSTRFMAINTERMGYHVGALNHNIGRPMGMMGSFMPW